MARALVRLILVLCAIGGGAAAGAMLSSPAGALPVDQTFNAVQPCVVFDSRGAQGASGGFLGPINGAQPVTYDVVGPFDPTQGGGAPGSDCGIPETATAVQINVVAVNALNEGNLRVTDGSPGSSGGVVNYNELTPKLNTANAVIVPIDATGHLVVTPNCGAGCVADSTDVRGVVLGYLTSGLADRVAALEALLADVTRIPVGVGGADTLRFSGMNVQVVDGTGTTACDDGTGFVEGEDPCNSEGNLVVGYAEDALEAARTGAHNLVVGPDNGWTSYGGAVFGESNALSGAHASVLGGGGNAAGLRGAVVGGGGNLAVGDYGAILGGSTNTVPDGTHFATVSGGDRNLSTGDTSSVSGGSTNVAEGNGSSVTGGVGNTATGRTAVVTGGVGNEADGASSSVTGGRDNKANGIDCGELEAASTVTGGRFNEASGCSSTVLGGGGATLSNGNLAYGPFSTISGGSSNASGGVASSVSGGANRAATGDHDWRAGTLFETS